MPRYYFDTHDGNRLVPDEEGLDLDNIEAARMEAQRGIATMAGDVFPDGDHREIVVTVRDGSGPVLRVRLLLVVESLA